MSRYLLGRLLQAVVTLFILVTIVFFLGRATGNPAALILGSEATPQAVAQLTHQLGLDKPLYIQYWQYLGQLFHGNFGASIHFDQPALSIYFNRLPITLELSGTAFALSIVLAIILGVLAGSHRHQFIDRIASLIAVLGISIPNFWLGILLVEFFAVRLGWLPVAGFNSPSSLVLPAITLAGFGLAAMTRLLRSSIIDSLDSEYVLFARSKGIAEGTVIWKHALKNALLPLLTYAGMNFGILLSGSIVVETVFAFPGVGWLSYEALTYRDFPLIQTVAILSGTLVIIANFLTDLLYSVINPKVKA